MLEFVEGTVAARGADELVLALGSVGLRLAVPARTVQTLQPGDPARLYTYLIVRDEGFDLYGFSTLEEREMFAVLLSVPQVGPKLAFRLVSALPPEELALAVRRGDLSALESVKGIGHRTAQRVMVELAEKLARWVPAAPTPLGDRERVVLQALTSKVLGFSEAEARRVVQKLAREHPNASVEEMIRLALMALARE